MTLVRFRGAPMWATSAGFSLACVLAGCAGMLWLGFRAFLAEAPLPPPTPASIQVAPSLTPRLVVFLIDGLREDIAARPELMPSWAALSEAGASGVTITPPMTLTTISVIDIATGLTPGISWSIKNFDTEAFEDESIVELWARSGREVALIGDASWAQLFGAWASRTYAVRDEGFMKGETGSISPTDAAILSAAEAALAAVELDVVVIHVVGLDKTAHREGAPRHAASKPPSAYAQAARALDAELGRLWRRYGASATWLVLSDHGVTEGGTHGGGEDETRRAPFVLVGPGVRRASGVEIPMTSLAGTLAALGGLRPPRHAETPAALELLTHTAEDSMQLLSAHAALRERVVEAARAESEPSAWSADPLREPLAAARASALLLGASPARESAAQVTRGHLFLPSSPAGDPLARIAAAHHALSDVESQRRQGYRWGLVALGLVLQAFCATWVLRRVGAARPIAGAACWIAVALAALTLPGWQFPLIQWLGAWSGSGLPGLIWRTAAAGAIVFFGVEGWRWLGLRNNSETIAAIACAGLALALGMSVVRWPYGPLIPMYRTIIALMAAAYLVWVRRMGTRREAKWSAVAATSTGALVVLAELRSLASAEAIAWDVGWGTILACTAWITRSSEASCAHPDSDRRPPLRLRATAALAAALAGASIAVSRLDAAWAVRIFLPVACLVALAWALAPTSQRVRIFGLWLAFLAIHRALGDPDQAVLVALAGASAWAWSASSEQPGRLAPLGAALMVVIGELVLFRELGYGYSFAALDVKVAFAATRDAIHLGEGFALLMLQHAAPWAALLLPFSVPYLRSPQLGSFAGATSWLVLTMAWGAAHSFERFVDDHWYTMHAVPLALFRGLSLVLVAVIILAAATITYRNNCDYLQGRPSSGT